MGLEAKCYAFLDGSKYLGNLHIDSQQITFSCRDIRWNHPVGANVAAKVIDGFLEIGKGKNTVRFQLADCADRWLQKLQNPPSRLKKLGIKQDQKVLLSGEFDEGFLDELNDGGAKICKVVGENVLVLCLVEDTNRCPDRGNCSKNLHRATAFG